MTTTVATPAPTGIKGVEAIIANFALAEYNANPQFIETLIASGEGALKSFLVTILSNVKIGGVVGAILNVTKGGIESIADSIIAAYTPAEIYTLVGGWLTNEVKAAGL